MANGRLLLALMLAAPLTAAAWQNPPAQTPPAQNPPGQSPPTPPAQNPPPQTTPPPTTPPPATTQTAAGTGTPQPPEPAIPFSEWLAAFRVEARGKGISDATLDAAFAGVEPNPLVITRDRAQPELTRSLDEYITSMMSAKRMTGGAGAIVRAKATLAKVEAAYGIPASMMVAIWGLESNYGELTGSYSEITSLATLAYDSRRPALFRGELIEALRIVDKGLVTPDNFKGSWAGAIGQPQFMPSSFLRHAVDFDGDGKIDIWTSEADVLASMARYLSAAGWVKGERWGREVRITQPVMDAIDRQVPMRTSGCRALREMTKPQPLATWRKLGVKQLSGSRLPLGGMDASLVRGVKRNFLIYRNYETLLAYNCSNAYAIAAGLMSDEFASPKSSTTKNGR
jgi:membrane-bound lytic murein transglycosylase B